jgi:hypothetical protein
VTVRACAPGLAFKELMARLGHSGPRAAMIYQHATQDRDKTIADGLGQLLRGAIPHDQLGRSVLQHPC